MARLFTSGFELNHITGSSEDIEWDVRSSGQTTVTTPVHGGDYAAKFPGSAGSMYLRHDFNTSNQDGPHYARAYVYWDSFPSLENAWFIGFQNTSGTIMCGFSSNSDGTIDFYESGSGGSGYVATSSALNTGQWYRFEMKLDRTGGSGSHVVEAKIDSTELYSTSTGDTATGVAQLDIGLDFVAFGVNDGVMYMDDVAINDGTGSDENNYPGEGKVIHLKPNATGDNADWTANNGGSNYLEVDEVTPDDETTHVRDTVLDEIDDYNIEASGLTNETIKVLQIGVRYKFSGSLTPPEFVIRAKASSGGTVEESSAIAFSDTDWHTNANSVPRNHPLTIYDKPGTSDPWTPSDLDSAQIGARISSGGSSNNVRVSTIWLMVEYAEPSTVNTASVSPIIAGVTLSTVTATYTSVLSASVNPITASLSMPHVSASYLTPSSSFLLKEDGDFLLKEDGDKIILDGAAETATVLPIQGTLSIPQVTATYIQIETASVSPITGTLAITSTTATYDSVQTASVTPITGTLALTSVTATYDSVLSASVSPITGSVSLTTVTATYESVQTASVTPITSTITLTSVTATYQSVQTATVTPITGSLTLTTVTATYTQAGVASVTPITSTLSLNSVTATYGSVLSASVDPIDGALSMPIVTASYVQIETASVSPLTATLSLDSPTATYESVLTASVDPLIATLSVDSPTATYQSALSASVSPITANLSIVSPTPTYEAQLTATVDPIVGTLSMPQVAAQSDSVGVAVVSPIVATINLTSVTATYVQTESAVVNPIVGTLSMPVVTATKTGTAVQETNAIFFGTNF